MDSVDREGTRDVKDEGNVVVALEHVHAVRRMLGDLGVRFTDVADNGDLGLALLEVADEGRAAGAVESRLAAVTRGDDPEAKTARTAPARFGDAQASSLDRFLRGLRALFAGRYAGWTPTLGKNRLVGNVEGGGGHISHSVDDPAAATWRPQPDLRVPEPGSGVRVGVLDTSICAHPWLAGGWVGPGTDLLRLASPYPALAGHGTFVTGLVLGQAPGCVVEFRRVLKDDGTARSWAVATKIVELGRTGLDVLNLSLGCFTEDNQPPLALATAIDRLDPDIVVVAAAGNHGDAEETPSGEDAVPPEENGRPRLTAADRRRPSWPAALDDVVAVGAADDQGVLAPFTPREVPWIDVVTHGVKVASTFLDGVVDLPPRSDGSAVPAFNGYARWSGSSFAAALVSGAIAARTRPGSVSARRAWQQLVEDRDGATASELRPGADPRFIQLLDGPRGAAAE